MSRVFRALLIFSLTLASTLSVSAQDTTGPASGSEALADQAFVREDYEAAEKHYREAVAASSTSVHARSRLGLLLAWRGEYEESIRFYREALALDPSDMVTRRGLATVLAWSEKFHPAVVMYREMLEERPGDQGLGYEMAKTQAWSGDHRGAEQTLMEILERNPGNVDARFLLAEVRGWAGDLGRAETVYRAILARDPDNLDAINGLGKMLLWQGEYEESLATYDRALAIDPVNQEALEGRARVLHWQGRPPEALEAIRQALAIYPDARDARRLGSDIGGPLRPSLQLFATTTQDTDDNDLETWGGVYKHHLGAKGYIGFSYAHAQTDALMDIDSPVAKYDTLRFIAGRHFSRYLSLYAELGYEETSFPLTEPSGDHSDQTEEHGAGSVTLEVNGPHWFTLVGSVSQERLVGTSQAFMNDIGIRAATVVAMFRPHSSVQLRVLGQKAELTDNDDFDVDSSFQIVTDPNQFVDDEGRVVLDDDDDNERDMAIGSATWTTPLERPRLLLNYELRWMSYDMTLDHGYFDPEHFVSNTAGLDLSDTIGRHFYWGAGASRGIQRINDEDDDVFGYRLLAGFNIGENISIEGYYARTDLALQSATGFKSTHAGIRLKFKFGHVLGPAAPGPDRP